MKFMKLVDTVNFGYDTLADFVESTFHPSAIGKTVAISAGAATFGSLVETYLGLGPKVLVAIFILFIVEVVSGVAASTRKEGKAFNSTKFGGGFVKLFVYLIMIGVSNIFYQDLAAKTMFGLQINIYEWLHYLFVNFTIINLVISNIENFERLGWDEFVPGLTKLNQFLKIGKSKKKDEEVEEVTED